MTIEETLKPYLLNVTNPSRYFPSEYIYGKKNYKGNETKCAICFPDLYEIGMSNNAVKIIYNQINNIDTCYCDRVFSVAPDFEELLRKENIPLFTVEQNFALNELDFLGISLGCELAATNVLQILELGHIAISKDKRKESDPIVIMGGPAATNPLPFSNFIDFVYIGESEQELSSIISKISHTTGRSARINALKDFKCLWYPGKKLAIRAIDNTFGKNNETKYLYNHYVVPAFEVAQDHGTAEIMRGCPNGCRFCHAGQYYKPFRQRDISSIFKIVQQNVNDFGYREVTLSSLSSGDYPNLDFLINSLNKNFKNKNISFSLPSLKVSSFSLGILEQISEVRKSGLTFAIETPLLDDQRSMNKEVLIEHLINIITEAKNRGWKLAKFYFMVGLPFVDKTQEERNIVDFLSKIRSATKINMNINIGTFIPKAHTPFQWSKQMTLEESDIHLRSIKRALVNTIPGIKVSYHDPRISFLEGIISRGGYECGKLIEKAYSYGCRLDAWDEYLNFEYWEKSIEDLNYDINKRSFEIDENLPWDSISLNVSKKYLLDEYEKAKNHQLTSICSEECDHHCGVCSKFNSINKIHNTEDLLESPYIDHSNELYHQVIIKYKKQGRACLNSHMSVMRQFEMAFQRASLDISFTQGFNPKPKLEFLNPLSMGISGKEELLLCELPESQINDSLINSLNLKLADGYTVISYVKLPINNTGKKISLASNLICSEIVIDQISDNIIKDNIERRIGLNNDINIIKSSGKYTVTVVGEKNYFKSLFDNELNKFWIASHCKIERTKLVINENLI